jgi:hypothetical protein
MTRVLVTGGRDFTDRDAVARAMAPYAPRGRELLDASEHIVIHGGCPTGADHLADEWCDVFGVRKRVYAADWRQHGRAAGPLRNARMIAEGRPDVVIAFPGGRGTADCVRKAQAAGVPVVFAARPASTSTRKEMGDRSDA